MSLFVLLAPEVVAVLSSGGCFLIQLWFQQFRCWWPHLQTKQLAHNLVSTNLLPIRYGTTRCLQCGWDWFILSSPTEQDTSARESSWVQKFKRVVSLLLLLYTQHALTSWKYVIIYGLYDQAALDGGCQHIMCDGLQTKQLGWHHMHLRVGWWATMYISNLKS